MNLTFRMLQHTSSEVTATTAKVVYRASCWDCKDCYIGKTKRRLHDRKTEHFKALTSNSHSSAIADHMTQTSHKIKWDYFDISATGQSNIH